MGRGKKTAPETLPHAIRRLEKVRAQRDVLAQAIDKIAHSCDIASLSDAIECARRAAEKVKKMVELDQKGVIDGPEQ